MVVKLMDFKKVFVGESLIAILALKWLLFLEVKKNQNLSFRLLNLFISAATELTE